eukprot:10704894-Lingulodinium_polyedra.AAC.1
MKWQFPKEYLLAARRQQVDEELDARISARATAEAVGAGAPQSAAAQADAQMGGTGAGGANVITYDLEAAWAKL